MGKNVGTICVGVGCWTYAPWRGIFCPNGLPQQPAMAIMARLG